MDGDFTLKKISIAVLGSDGQLGNEFRRLAPSFEFCHFDFFTRHILDISDIEALKRVFLDKNYDYVINCAAYTAVDKAETDVENCYDINATACANLAKTLIQADTRLIHFSSDYVYHSYDGFPLREDGTLNPKGVYASSKLEGENLIRATGIPALILRTSWVVSSFGHNFVKTMLRLGQERPTISVVNDQYGAPTFAKHLGIAVLDIILQASSNPDKENLFNDTYNFANEGIITWYDLATQIMAFQNLPCKVMPILSKDYPTPAVRPHWSVLSKLKIKKAFNIEIPHWYTAISECLDDISYKK